MMDEPHWIKLEKRGHGLLLYIKKKKKKKKNPTHLSSQLKLCIIIIHMYQGITLVAHWLFLNVVQVLIYVRFRLGTSYLQMSELS